MDEFVDINGIRILKSVVEAYLKNVWPNVVWSFSRINTGECMLEFVLSYLHKVSSDNYFAYRGTSVHNSLEDYHKYAIANGALPEKVVQDTLYKKFTRKMEACPHQVEGYFKKGEAAIADALLNYEVRSDIIHVERELTFEYKGYKFRGFIDYETADYHGDYKSTWSDPKYGHQQRLYVHAKGVADGVQPKKFEITEYGKMMNRLSIDVTQEEVTGSLEWAVAQIELIKSKLESMEITDKTDEFYCKQLCKKCPKGWKQ